MTFVWRRSVPSLGGLAFLLIVVGYGFTTLLGAPVWTPVAFAIAVVVLQYLVNPYIIQWLVPAAEVPRTDTGYATSHPVGEMVARQCRAAGVPLVRLGIVDDGNPNAFTFGRTRSDARMWLTRGLLERLDDDELEAVVAHEVGHVRNWDFAVMTVAAVVPMVLYLVYVTARGSNRGEARTVAIGAYVAYIVSQFVVLSLSRAREYGADRWSCTCTANGDALASALVKIAYGMGQVHAEQAEAAARLAQGSKAERKALAKEQAGVRRMQSMRAMGIFEPKLAQSMSAALAKGIDADRALAAMRWDAVNPWARTLELASSHPLVVHRIQALEDDTLEGRPRQWSVLRSLAQVSADERWAARATFARQLGIAVAPWAVLAPMLLVGAFTGSAAAIGLALVAAGILLFVKQAMRYPTTTFAPVREVTSLLERLDASPVSGIPVEVRGTVIGRGMPGYVLSPDLVVQDESGFVPLLYRQPVPFLATLFGLFRAKDFIGRDVTARGWFRRMPGPVIELRDLVAADGRRARAWEWMGRYVASAAVLTAGVLILLAAAGS